MSFDAQHEQRARRSPRSAVANRDRPLKLAMLLSHPIQYIAPLLRRIAREPGIDLTVFYMTDTGLRPRNLKGYGETMTWDVPLLDGYRHEFLPNRSWDSERKWPGARLNPGIFAKLARGRFDALLLHGYVSATEWMAFAAAHALRVPLLFWGDVLVDSKFVLTRSQRARELFRTAFCKGVDAALAMSTQARRFYEHYGVDDARIFWVPLCVDRARWTERIDASRARREDVRTKLGLDAQRPVIAYVAHMRANKRPRDVIDAVARMKTPASLLMAGGGPLFDEMRAYVSDRKLEHVRLLGPTNQSDLPDVYAAADVFVLPSDVGEVTPLVVQEAMCGALPVVLSDKVPSHVDFVREAENGFTFPVGDVDALARTLDSILENAERARTMGDASRRIIEAWDYEVAVRGLVQALAAVCA